MNQFFPAGLALQTADVLQCGRVFDISAAEEPAKVAPFSLASLIISRPSGRIRLSSLKLSCSLRVRPSLPEESIEIRQKRLFSLGTFMGSRHWCGGLDKRSERNRLFFQRASGGPSRVSSVGMRRTSLRSFGRRNWRLCRDGKGWAAQGIRGIESSGVSRMILA